MVKVYLKTLGCPKNSVDSERLSRALSAAGVVPTGTPDNANIFLINTCGFIREAKEESIGEILSLAKLKDTGSPGFFRKKLFVFGCLAERYRDELTGEIPEIDAIWGLGKDADIVEACRSLVVPAPLFPDTGAPLEDQGEKKISYAYLKIAEGCNRKCTFCVIPSIRGRFRSASAPSIIAEAKRHIASDVRELILVAQDITSYGREYGEYALVDLLRDISALEGDFLIRLLYLYPTSVTDDLIRTVAENDRIIKYLDIPFQHASDRMLRLMGRAGTRKEYLRLLRKIRRSIPGVTLRTSFIVGFPGETDDDFGELIDFMEEIRFDRLGSFMYSQEEGTPAALMKGQVPRRVREKRFHELMTRQASISYEKNSELVGRCFPGFVDGTDAGAVYVRLYSQTPEVDGIVIAQLPSGETEQPDDGSPVTVEITEAYDYDLAGKIVRLREPGGEK